MAGLCKLQLLELQRCGLSCEWFAVWSEKALILSVSPEKPQDFLCWVIASCSSIILSYAILLTEPPEKQPQLFWMSKKGSL